MFSICSARVIWIITHTPNNNSPPLSFICSEKPTKNSLFLPSTVNDITWSVTVNEKHLNPNEFLLIDPTSSVLGLVYGSINPIKFVIIDNNVSHPFLFLSKIIYDLNVVKGIVDSNRRKLSNLIDFLHEKSIH